MKPGKLSFKPCLKATTWLIAAIACATTVAQTSSNVIWSVQESSNVTVSNSIVFSPDGRLLATGRSDSNTVNLRSAADGTFRRALNGRDNDARSLAFSPDSNLLVTGAGGPGDGLGLNLWSVPDGVRLRGRIPSHNNGTIGVAFSPDGQLVATCGFHDRNIKLWHVPDMTLVNTINNFDPDFGVALFVAAIAFSPDGELLASGDSHGIKLRRVSDGALLSTIGGTGKTDVVSLAFAPDGQTIAAGVNTLDSQYGRCIDCSLKLWRIDDGKLLRTFNSEAGDLLHPKISFAKDERMIAAGFGNRDETGAIQFWRSEDGAAIFIDRQPSDVHAFATSPAANVYGYILADGTIAVAQSPELSESSAIGGLR